jgi:hypothetical protein
MSRTPNSASAQQRPKRTPVGSRNVLSVVGKEDGYVYRFVNDSGDRVAQYLEAGYEMVPASAVRVGDKRVNNPTPEGSNAQVSVGHGQKGFLMRIKDEWYKEDQAAKQAHVNELEQAIKNISGKADFGNVSISTRREE